MDTSRGGAALNAAVMTVNDGAGSTAFSNNSRSYSATYPSGGPGFALSSTATWSATKLRACYQLTTVGGNIVAGTVAMGFAAATLSSMQDTFESNKFFGVAFNNFSGHANTVAAVGMTANSNGVDLPGAVFTAPVSAFVVIYADLVNNLLTLITPDGVVHAGCETLVGGINDSGPVKLVAWADADFTAYPTTLGISLLAGLPVGWVDPPGWSGCVDVGADPALPAGAVAGSLLETATAVEFQGNALAAGSVFLVKLDGASLLAL